MKSSSGEHASSGRRGILTSLSFLPGDDFSFTLAVKRLVDCYIILTLSRAREPRVWVSLGKWDRVRLLTQVLANRRPLRSTALAGSLRTLPWAYKTSGKSMPVSGGSSDGGSLGQNNARPAGSSLLLLSKKSPILLVILVRKGDLVDLTTPSLPTSPATLVFRVPTRKSFGLRASILTASKGTASVHAASGGYQPVPLGEDTDGLLKVARNADARGAGSFIADRKTSPSNKGCNAFIPKEGAKKSAVFDVKRGIEGSGAKRRDRGFLVATEDGAVTAKGALSAQVRAVATNNILSSRTLSRFTATSVDTRVKFRMGEVAVHEKNQETPRPSASPDSRCDSVPAQSPALQRRRGRHRAAT